MAALQHIEDILTIVREQYKIVEKIVNDEQNNIVHQNYGDRSVLLRPTDDSINAEIHQEAPNTIN